MRKINAIFAVLALYGMVGSLLAAGCEDGFSVTTNPEIEITVDGQTVAKGGDGTVEFTQALDLAVDKQVRILNPGDAPLVITSIDWKDDPDTGGKMVNKHVSLDQLGGYSFPYTVDEGGADRITFQVRYQPPFGQQPDDLSPSVLVIKSNATDETGKVKLAEIEVTFTLPAESACPQVNPPNYTFSGATPTQPERQTFQIENCIELGSAPFTVESITLAQPSNVFRIENAAVSGTVVKSPKEPDYVPASFDVVYTPTGSDTDQKENTVLVKVSTSPTPIQVPLKTNTLTGDYEVSYQHPNKFDFSNVFTKECRRVNVLSKGPAPMTVRAPSITPTEAAADFTWSAWLPPTSPEDPEVEVTVDGPKKFPQVLAGGKSMEFEVCYDPQGDPSASANGIFSVPIDILGPSTIDFDLFAGTPKSIFKMAPANDTIRVSADFGAAESGTRHVVIYNTGNGDMTVKNAETVGKFVGQDAEVFQVTSPATWPQIVPAYSFLVLELAWDSSVIDAGTTEDSEGLEITYLDDFLGEDTVKNVQLDIFDATGVELPVADPGTDPGAIAGETVTLDASASTPGAGTFEGDFWCTWYLTSKPDGATVVLNQVGGPTVAFSPDAPGEYRVELVVESAGADETSYFSKPAELVLQVD